MTDLQLRDDSSLVNVYSQNGGLGDDRLQSPDDIDILVHSYDLTTFNDFQFFAVHDK